MPSGYNLARGESAVSDVAASGTRYAGGALGEVIVWRYDFNTPASVQMQDISASGDESGSGDAYGGLVGYLEADRRGISIALSFASGHLTVGEGSVEARSGETLRVDRSYATGSAPVERSFWDVDTSATSSAPTHIPS